MQTNVIEKTAKPSISRYAAKKTAKTKALDISTVTGIVVNGETRPVIAKIHGLLFIEMRPREKAEYLPGAFDTMIRVQGVSGKLAYFYPQGKTLIRS